MILSLLLLTQEPITMDRLVGALCLAVVALIIFVALIGCLILYELEKLGNDLKSRSILPKVRAPSYLGGWTMPKVHGLEQIVRRRSEL